MKKIFFLLFGASALFAKGQTLTSAVVELANTFAAGAKQTFQASATTAGTNWTGVASDPSALVNGDLWHNTTSSRLKFRSGGTTFTLATTADIPAAPTTVSGSLLGIRYITSGTTYTPTSGTTMIQVHLLGAGGGGGGSAGVASGSGAGAGGGAGAYVVRTVTGISSATTYTIAVGASGTAGAAASSGTGGTGGSTTFTTAAGSTPASTTITAAGGVGGAGQAATTTASATSPALGGTGGTGTNGDVNGAGESGDYGMHFLAALSVSGTGGKTPYGGGGKSVIGTTTGSAGNAGTGYGSGGGGAASGGNTNVAGGAGGPGLIIIYEWK